MKKNKKNNKVPACAFGMEQLQGIGGLTNLFGSGMQALGKEGSTGSIAGGALSGLGSGAAAGAALGPIGAGVGAAIGGIGGLLKGVFNKKAIDKQKEKDKTLTKTNYGLGNTAVMTNDFYQDPNYQAAYTFANGGIMPNSDLAYLDNGEVIRDTAGNMGQVPNTKQGTDNHLVNSTNLESVLSNKLKRPGTSKTFAEEGKRVLKMARTSKGKDKFAEITNKLNETNANNAYSQLLAEQEQLKQLRGIKAKTKNLVPAAANGLASNFKNITNTNNLGYLPPEQLPGSTLLQAPSFKPIGSSYPTKFGGNITSPTKTTNRQFNIPKIPKGFASDLMSLAPTVLNTISGIRDVETEPTQFNQYAGSTLNSLASRRMNIQPAVESNRRTRAINNYNASQTNTSTGANLAMRTQSAVDEYARNADIYFNAQNANNQYLGDYANMTNNMGNIMMQENARVSDINARNRAARRTALGTAATQLSQYGQNKELMRNQRGRDDMMYPLLSNFLSQGFTADQIQQLNNRYYGR